MCDRPLDMEHSVIGYREDALPALDLSILAPELPDTAQRVKEFLNIPCDKRLFNLKSRLPIEEEKTLQGSPVDMSLSPKKLSASFDLSFIDNVVVKKVGKGTLDVARPSVAKTPEVGPSVKSDSKKRKETPMTDLEGLSVSMAMKKAVSYVDKVSNYVDKMEDIMLSKMEEDSKALEDKDKIIEELKASIECERHVWMGKQEVLTKEHAEKVTQIQNSAALVVFEARLAMAKQAAAEGFTSPNWDIKTWEETVINLGGKVTGSFTEDKAEKQTENVQIDEGTGEAMVGDAEMSIWKDVEGL